jgi:hypothetical protein
MNQHACMLLYRRVRTDDSQQGIGGNTRLSICVMMCESCRTRRDSGTHITFLHPCIHLHATPRARIRCQPNCVLLLHKRRNRLRMLPESSSYSIYIYISHSPAAINTSASHLLIHHTTIQQRLQTPEEAKQQDFGFGLKGLSLSCDLVFFTATYYL